MFIELPIGVALTEEIASKEAIGASDDIEWKKSIVSINPQFIESFWSSEDSKKTTVVMTSGDTIIVYLDYNEVKRRLKHARVTALTEGVG